MSTAWKRIVSVVSKLDAPSMHITIGNSNASWLDQIEIWFSILQRKCLQPNHFVSTSALEAALDEYIAYYNQKAKPINWTYTAEKLELQLSQKLGAHL